MPGLSDLAGPLARRVGFKAQRSCAQNELVKMLADIAVADFHFFRNGFGVPSKPPCPETYSCEERTVSSCTLYCFAVPGIIRAPTDKISAPEPFTLRNDCGELLIVRSEGGNPLRMFRRHLVRRLHPRVILEGDTAPRIRFAFGSVPVELTAVEPQISRRFLDSQHTNCVPCFGGTRTCRSLWWAARRAFVCALGTSGATRQAAAATT